MNWINSIFALVLTALLLMVAHTGAAAEKERTCTYQGKAFKGSSFKIALSQAANFCMNQHLKAAEIAGRELPEGEVEDLTIEDCVNNSVCI